MVLRLLSLKQFSRFFVLRQNLTHLGFPSSSPRTLTSSTVLKFPRGIKIKESLEDEDDVEDWEEFMSRRVRNRDQEAKISTRFGSVRVDSDNIALVHGQNDEVEEGEDISPSAEAATEEKEEVGSFEHVRLDVMRDEKADFSEYLFEESMNPEFFRPKEFNVKKKGKSEEKTSPFLVREQSKENLTIPIDFSDVRQKVRVQHTENKTVLGDFEKASKKDSSQEVDKILVHSDKDIESGDLNYLDNVAFGAAFSSFSAQDCNRKQTVKVEPDIIDSSRRQLSETDLNEIDKEFFGQGVNVDAPNLFDIDINEPETVRTVPSPDLNSQQMDNKLSTNEYDSSENKTPSKDPSLAEDLNYIDEQFFSVTSPSPQTEPQSPNEPLTLTPFTASPVEKQADSENIKEGKKKAKSKKEKKSKEKQHQESSPAMDYVRKLRKPSTGDEKIKDSADMIGVNLQARLNAVTLVDQPQIKTKDKSGAGSEEENSQNFLPVTRFCPPKLEKYTSIELEELLLSKIIYNDHDIVGLWKPYGLPMFSTDQDEFNKRKINYYHNLEKYLPKLAAKLDCERLYEVHRLDRTTTGVVIFARTEERRKHLKELFAKRKISKTYLAIVNGSPQPEQGIINIPVSDGKIGDRFRKTLRPDYVQSSVITNKKNYKGNVSAALTEFRTLGSHGNASLLELKMLSGVKHQIRIHLGLGLGTPVLGDHKYSYADQLGKPQRVYGDITNRMKVKKSKTRHLPIFLHARSIHIPEIYTDRDLWINANLPHFFSKTLKTLKLKNSFD